MSLNLQAPAIVALAQELVAQMDRDKRDVQIKIAALRSAADVLKHALDMEAVKHIMATAMGHTV